MSARVVRFTTAIVVLGGWEAAGRSGLLPGTVLPPVSAVLASLVALLRTRTIWFDMWVSVWAIGVGLGIGIAAGLVFAALVATRAGTWRLLEPLLYYLGSLPKIIVLPVFILFLSSGIYSKVGMAAVSAFFPVAITAAHAVHEVATVHVRAARCLGASRGQLLTKVYAPSAIGPILSGLRIGLGVAVTGVLLAETAVASAGMGFRAIQFYNDLRISEMYALLFLVFILAATVNALFGRLIRHLTRYTRSRPEEVFFS
jgi:ABC-type nitrate/sulfonate/bicarbonate transport system permease component